MSKIEVYLNENQVNTLKSILNQSALGVHILFDNHLISEVFQTDYSEDDFFQAENIKKVQDHLLQLMQFQTLHEKKGYINSLDIEARHQLVRAYFYIIENNLRTQQKLPH